MATKERLFDKPIPELREAFVRARFGQADVFGKSDIEEWLAMQRKAERPIEHMWRRFIDTERVRRPFHIRELLDLAVPQELPRGFPIRQMADVGDPLVAMLYESVDRERVDVLPADERLTLFLLRGEDGAPAHVFALTPQSNPKRRLGDSLTYTLYAPSDKDLLQVVLGRGWSVGPKKIATAARRFLCDALAEEVKRERAKAEHDFDTAVAVNADGTKIVHADWVVVSDQAIGPTLLTVYPSGAFRAQKARRPDGNRFDRDATERLIDERGAATWTSATGVADIAHLGWGRHRQIIPVEEPSALLLDCKLSGRTTQTVRIYIASAALCPSPLPDGGVEVTV